MERILAFLPLASLLIGGWAVLNGVLHDVFVLVQGRKYDRDLLRLLMDGHILITCGIMQMIAWTGLKEGSNWAYYVSGAAAISLLVYCGMIFPFLKSFGMMFLNVVLISMLVISFVRQ
jgi:hypothetical protein